jgi:hypothetical protein
MQFIQSLFVYALVCRGVLAVPTKPQECNAGPAKDLLGYAPALAYCASSYPPVPVTTIVTDIHTAVVEGKPTTYAKTVPHILPTLTKTTSTRYLVTATATTTDWNNRVSTW